MSEYFTAEALSALLQVMDPAALSHQVNEITPITPLVTCHRLHDLVCPCCSTST